MKKLSYLLAALLLLASCEHKELCYQHPHLTTVRVEFDWRDAPDASPAGMFVYFYPLEGGNGQRIDFEGTAGAAVTLGRGRYVAAG